MSSCVHELVNTSYIYIRYIERIHLLITKTIFFKKYSISAPSEVNSDATPIVETAKPFPTDIDRRLSRDIGIQAFSVEIEEEKEKLIKSVEDNEIRRSRDFRKSKCMRQAPQTTFSDFNLTNQIFRFILSFSM